MTNNPRTDEYGRLIGFPHHDGALESVLLADVGKTVILVVRSSDSVLRRLVLRDVLGLHVTDLRQGNTIQSIQIWNVATARERAPGVLDDVRTRLYLETEALPPAALILSLTPSYGANVLAVMGEVEAADQGNDRK